MWFSAESKSREESAKQLGGLIKACERLMVPYITPVLKVSSSIWSFKSDSLKFLVAWLLLKVADTDFVSSRRAADPYL